MTTIRNSNRAFLWMGISCALLAGGRALRAEIAIVTVPVGDLGNAPDYNPGNGKYYGSVGYAYSIAAFDVTSSQYTAFLNAVAASDPDGVYNSNMAGTSNGYPGIIQNGASGSYSYSVAAGRGNDPVTQVTYLDTLRFANWIDNDQPTGPEGTRTTEMGSYNLTSGAISSNTVTRNSNAVWTVPTEDEWYKAAYYSPALNNNTGGYYAYPTGNVPDPTKANYDAAGSSGDTTPVGSYPYPTYYGTYDQGGDVYQWSQPAYGNGYADLRGGSFNSADPGSMKSTEFYTEPLGFNSNNTGFRLSELGNAPVVTDVAANAIVMHDPLAGAIAAVTAELQTGYNGGNWNGSAGYISTTAATDTTHRTAIGVIINDTGANTGHTSGNPIYTTIDNTPTTAGDILLKYTWYGDANLSGRVDGSDYSLIDNGALNHLTGWYNGDFNYDGTINGSDYTLIDNSFNAQGPSMADEIASTTAQIAGQSTVPEPGAVLLLCAPLAGILRHRPRKNPVKKR